MTINKEHIARLTNRVARAEKVTKVVLGQLSRDLLTYVIDSQDIAAANRLIEVLTPVNKRITILYLTHFLPWSVESDIQGTFIRFGSKVKGDKMIKRKTQMIIDFLAEESNNLWAWAEKNIEVEVKQKDFKYMIEKVVGQALEGHEASGTEALKPTDVIAAVLNAGVSLEDMLTAIANEEKAKVAPVADEVNF